MLPAVSWGVKKGRFPFQEVPAPSQGDKHLTHSEALVTTGQPGAERCCLSRTRTSRDERQQQRFLAETLSANPSLRGCRKVRAGAPPEDAAA